MLGAETGFWLQTAATCALTGRTGDEATLRRLGKAALTVPTACSPAGGPLLTRSAPQEEGQLELQKMISRMGERVAQPPGPQLPPNQDVCTGHLKRPMKALCQELKPSYKNKGAGNPFVKGSELVRGTPDHLRLRPRFPETAQAHSAAPCSCSRA